MAYLFLSQQHKANAGEWSCDTYCGKDYRGLCLSTNVRQHTLDTHSRAKPAHVFLTFDCLEFFMAVICIKNSLEFKIK